MPTISSTPSYPRRRASSKALDVLSGYTDEVDKPTFAGGIKTDCEATGCVVEDAS
jgi:hypothetical protein